MFSLFILLYAIILYNIYDIVVNDLCFSMLINAGDVTGKGQIPYGDLAKLGCVITGLPRGIAFKQPSQYSSSELQQVFNCIDNIKFLEVPEFTDQDVIVEQEIITSEHE